MTELLKEFGLRWEDGLRALAAGYGMIAVIVAQRFAVHLRQDWAGSINQEVLLDTSFFLPRLIIFSMTAFLLLVRHKMAYVFFGLSSGIILWMLVRLLTGAYSESSLWGQCVTGVWF